MSVTSGNTKSCGCHGLMSRSIRFKKHGLRNHDVYRRWCGIKSRCYNKKRSDYKYYGAIGVTLSDEFMDFKSFFDYVSNLPLFENRITHNLTIDRINPIKNYEKNNLRWATKKEQAWSLKLFITSPEELMVNYILKPCDFQKKKEGKPEA